MNASFLNLLIEHLPMVVCFFGGIVLLVVEAFMPGFGVPGISGIVLELFAIYLCYIGISPLAALVMALIALALLILAVSLSLRSVAKGRLSKTEMVLNDRERPENGYSAAQDMKAFLGLEGTASTVLRPAGIAAFDGVKLNVVSSGDYIPAGERVRVVRVDGNRIVVDRL